MNALICDHCGRTSPAKVEHGFWAEVRQVDGAPSYRDDRPWPLHFCTVSCLRAFHPKLGEPPGGPVVAGPSPEPPTKPRHRMTDAERRADT